jgi:hypothetical protein
VGSVAAVLLGVWLTLTPITVLDGYLHFSGAQGEVLGTLLETGVYGYLLLQVMRILCSFQHFLCVYYALQSLCCYNALCV